MTSRTDMAKKLGCSEVMGLSKEFQTMAQNMTVRYLLLYSSNESGYKLDENVVKNRVENLMADALAENPALTAREFAASIKIPEIFMDTDAITYLVELVGEACEDDWFFYAYHFFSAYVYSFIFHHPYYMKSLEREEVICVLYQQVYRALKSCAAKKSYFNFMTLKLMFKAAVFELSGAERFPFTLHRKDAEQYFRFRATIRNNNFGMNDTEVIAKSLSISVTKIESYWQIYIMESKGFISTSLVLDDENAEYIFGKTEELGFADAEITEIRNRLFSSEEDRRIFDSLIGNGDGVFTKHEIEALNTSRYHINQVKERVRQDREGKGNIKPIK